MFFPNSEGNRKRSFSERYFDFDRELGLGGRDVSLGNRDVIFGENVDAGGRTQEDVGYGF